MRMIKHIFILLSLFGATACSVGQNSQSSHSGAQDITATELEQEHKTAMVASGKTETAIFAGGCFWCIEADFEKLPGVLDVVSGYTGGETINPTYKQVTYADTGHYEAVKVTYDPMQLSYDEVLTYFWHHIDPTDPRGQFCDKGSSYRTAIFAHSDQKAMAMASKANIVATKPFKADIVTPVLNAEKFYLAENYHQDYYKKNPAHYNRYRRGCRRDATVKALWGDVKTSGPSDGSETYPVKAGRSYGSGE